MTTRRWSRTGSTSAARVIQLVGAVFALIEVIYILLLMFGANAGNAFFRFIQSLAEPLALFWPGLFPIKNYDLSVLVNYGLAAVFWLVVAGFLARLVSR
jgi:hypothetical protein